MIAMCHTEIFNLSFLTKTENVNLISSRKQHAERDQAHEAMYNFLCVYIIQI